MKTKKAELRFIDHGITAEGSRYFRVCPIGVERSSDALSLLADRIEVWTKEIVKTWKITCWSDQCHGVNFLNPMRKGTLDFYFPGIFSDGEVDLFMGALTERFDECYA